MRLSYLWNHHVSRWKCEKCFLCDVCTKSWIESFQMTSYEIKQNSRRTHSCDVNALISPKLCIDLNFLNETSKSEHYWKIKWLIFWMIFFSVYHATSNRKREQNNMCWTVLFLMTIHNSRIVIAIQRGIYFEQVGRVVRRFAFKFSEFYTSKDQSGGYTSLKSECRLTKTG